MSTKLIPYVGMPATMCIGGDRYAGSIVEIKRNGRTVVFSFANRPDRTEEYTLRRGGLYVEKGSKNCFLSLGVARDYRDPSF